jgi:hypothetical protein
MVQTQKTVLRKIASRISEPMHLELVMEQAKKVYPRLNLTEHQARSTISCYQVGPNMFCGQR